jgi:hypothetical protein
MRIVNRSKKIIGIKGEPLLPGDTMRLPEGYESHPVIADYLKRGIVADEAKEDSPPAGAEGISDLERARIAREAVAEYKKAQEETEAAKWAENKSGIKAVKAMRKSELLTKAAGMGLQVSDDDTVDILREKIIAALDQ